MTNLEKQELIEYIMDKPEIELGTGEVIAMVSGGLLAVGAILKPALLIPIAGYLGAGMLVVAAGGLTIYMMKKK